MKVGAAWRLVRQPRHRHATEQRLEMPLAVSRRLARHPLLADHRSPPLELGAKPEVLFEQQPRPFLALPVEHCFQLRVRLADHLVAREDSLDLRRVRSRSSERRLDGLNRVGMRGTHRGLLPRTKGPRRKNVRSPPRNHAPRKELEEAVGHLVDEHRVHKDQARNLFIPAKG